MFAQGDLQLVILALLAQQPRHGYELIKAIEEKFGGQYTPSPGAIYPTLTLLEEQGYARSGVDAEGGTRRLYTLTEEGAAYVAAHQAELDGVMARMELAARAMAGEAAPEAVMQAMHTLKHALVFRRGGWPPEEVKRVCALIEEAANAIVSGGPAK